MKHFHFNVELFLTKQDSLSCLCQYIYNLAFYFVCEIVMMVYGSFICMKVGDEMLLKL